MTVVPREGEIVFSYVEPEGKFPAWLTIYADGTGGLKIFLRGRGFLLDKGYAEPGHLETVTIPPGRIPDFLLALCQASQLAQQING